MKCPKCQIENSGQDQFCRECGAMLSLTCPYCAADVFKADKFCSKCGQGLNEVEATEEIAFEAAGERKHVTALFSDLSGYTTMSEKMDPEELKDVTSRIFGEISIIVGNYDGFIEKYAGDAVLALFGVPKAHEDDPVRAIKVAREIHELVDAISPELEQKIGQPI
jgi:class 3 adenylate cyclase